MIVRLMGEGQYRTDDSLLERLNEIDDRATAAVEAGDAVELDKALGEMSALVKDEGERLPDEHLSASDVIVPPSDLTLEETRQFLSQEGFIPDLPAPPD